MNGTVIQEYKNGHIIKSGGLYYLVDGTEKSLTQAVGYSTIKDLVEADKKDAKTESKPKARKKSK